MSVILVFCFIKSIVIFDLLILMIVLNIFLIISGVSFIEGLFNISILGLFINVLFIVSICCLLLERVLVCCFIFFFNFGNLENIIFKFFLIFVLLFFK